jgi:flagellar motor switch protein FliN/FliY
VALQEASIPASTLGNVDNGEVDAIDGTGLGSPQNVAGLELGALRQAPMTVQVEVGRTTMTLGEILDEIDVGSNIRLDRHAGEPVEVYVNGALFARAEVVMMQDQIGAKIVEIVDSTRRLRPSGLR